MAEKKSWTLSDVGRSRWEESVFLGHDQLGVADCTVSKRTLHGGLQDGVDIVHVNNGELSFSVLPTRGMGIWKASYRDIPIGWQSPARGPVHPKFVNLQERGGLGWLYGFDELLARCGMDSNGAPGEDVIIDNNGNPSSVNLTLHGRVANLPAHRVDILADAAAGTVSVSGEVDESALFCPGLRLKTTISTKRLSNAITLVEEIENLKSTPAEMQMLYHWNFGPPFLGRGSKLLAPVRELAPRDPRAAEGMNQVDTYLPPTPGYVEQVYFYELHAGGDGKTLIALKNAAGDRAVTLRFASKELPCFTQWKNTVGESDGYVTGLEPGTNYPNPKKVERERGRVVKIAPGESYRCEVTLEIQAGRDEVSKIEKEIAALQSAGAPKIHPKPVPKFS